ncbi:MAG: AAA domain-containing protein [Chitinivibrionales bacterium]|nr:AAA domain-containing protein [Chitinivibrionales bacterium]
MGDDTRDVELLEQLFETVKSIKSELAKAIVGQQEVIDDLLACFLAEGHCLLIGVPGLAKTMLVQSLARTLDMQFNRIQFTPDLMPSDITGSEILFEDRASGMRELRFMKGPLFANVVLADEINRTPPKTQSALLQAMQEREVTSSGQTHPLPSPFWILATQNPIEQEGTYPLPEAQQDRFMFSLEIGYPDAESEVEIARTTTVRRTYEIQPVVSIERLQQFRDLIWRVPVADSTVRYAVGVARATRPDDDTCPENVKQSITWGAGPRASQYLILAAKAYAVLDNRPTPDAGDIKRAAYNVLRHRLVRSFHAEVEGTTTNDLIRMVIESVKE